jgi:hypothetical protein
MAFMEDLKNYTYRAASALATQFIFVTRNASGQVAATGAGLRADGVLLTTASTIDEAVTVAYDGRVMVKAGGTIARNGAVASNASGLAVAATTGNVILGYATEAAVINQIITVELNRAGTLAP